MSKERDQYFMSVQKPTDDGAGIISSLYSQFSVDSATCPSDVFGEALANMKEYLKDKPGRYDNIQVLAFNRI